MIFSVPLEFLEVRNHTEPKEDKTCMDVIDTRYKIYI